MKQRIVYLTGPERVELRLEPVPEPGPGEVLVRIGAATTCGTDVKVFRRGSHPRMLRAPSPFGHEMAGTVAAVGPGPSLWSEGDRVFVANSASCGSCRFCRQGRENLCEDLQYLNGAFAEYILVPQRFALRSLHPLPPSLDFPQAALAEPLACVLHGVDACGLHGPAEVAVFGSGPIGLLFVAVLSSAGHRVVAADPNASRLEAALRLGAAGCVQVVRGERQAHEIVKLSDGAGGFDLAVEATGVPEAWQDAVGCVRPGGLVNLFGGCAPGTTVPLDTHRLHYSEITVRGTYHHRPATVRRALDLLAGGNLSVDVLLSAERPLEELEDALRSMMRKEALKVVVRP